MERAEAEIIFSTFSQANMLAHDINDACSVANPFDDIIGCAQGKSEVRNVKSEKK